MVTGLVIAYSPVGWYIAVKHDRATRADQRAAHMAELN
jgi:hypothetical protein